LDDWSRSEQFAKEGYENMRDAYTASVLAYVYSKQSKHKEAIDLYRSAILTQKDYVTAQYNLMGEYLKVKDFKRAYDLAQELGDSFKYSSNVLMRAKILNNLGVALWAMNRKSDAADAFKEALLLHPKFTLAEENLREIQLGDAPTDVTEDALATQ
jgi:tetratricopeptide (TPR) repeat protein